MKEGKEMKVTLKEMRYCECVFCETPADFTWYDDNGPWSVCLECIKEGKTEAEAEEDAND
jgi:hypothetical protein